MDYLIFKLNHEDIQQMLIHGTSVIDVARGHWRITPKKVEHVKRALVVYNAMIVAEFKVGETQMIYQNDNQKMGFDLQPLVAKSTLVGTLIDYPTSNRASVVTQERLQTLQK